MTKLSKNDYSDIDIHELLKHRRQVAIIWSVKDLQGVRPDLNANQAYEVLLECDRKHDAECGFTWTFLKDMADELFPIDRKSANGTEKSND